MQTKPVSRVAVTIWGVCPSCRGLHPLIAPCSCRHVVDQERPLPRWPLILCVLLAQLVLGGGIVGVIWWLWRWGG